MFNKNKSVLCVFFFLVVMDVIYLIYLNQFLIFFFLIFFLFSVIVYILLNHKSIDFLYLFCGKIYWTLFVIISLYLHMKLTYLKNLVLCSVGNFQLYIYVKLQRMGYLILLFIIIRIQ
jgi:hypothetical protein